MLDFEIGNPGWTREDILAEFDNFCSVYSNRPIKYNVGGMRSQHAFATYFMLKKINPETVIESGVWKGQGTWLIEQACPNAKIICIDVSFKKLSYKSKNAEYLNRDFSYINFDGIDKSSALIFFDDHQNALMRLQQMKWKGFCRAIFDDNYPPMRGDCYSLQKIFSNSGFSLEALEARTIRGLLKGIALNLTRSSGLQEIEPNSTHSAELKNNLSLYYEFPPLFGLDSRRWLNLKSKTNALTKEPLFDDSFSHIFRSDASRYNWICLVELA